VHYPEHVDGLKARKRAETFADHYSQATLFWNSMSSWEKEHIVAAYRFELGKVTAPHIRERMVEHLNHIDHTLALAVAAGIHLAAISFAMVQQVEPRSASAVPAGPPVVTVELPEPNIDPQPDLSEPLPTPPVIDQFYLEQTATPPPVHRTPTKFAPVVRPRTNIAGKSVNVSEAKIFALSAPRPEYPYEARRQKITGDGIALLTIDPNSGDVIQEWAKEIRLYGGSYLLDELPEKRLLFVLDNTLRNRMRGETV
jgi:hypothetical protein